MSKFYLVATPIGNLSDVTLRALDVLKSVNLIIAENPRTTRILLQKYQITKNLLGFNEHSDEKTIDAIMERLKDGQDLALVSEAGTPAIADPGGKLVARILEKIGDQVNIVPIPGSSVLTAMLSVSGFNVNRFLFLGFLPKKKRRKTFLEIIKNSEFPVIVYESVYRVEKLLQELANLDIKEMVVGRELTKKFEAVYRGTPQEILEKLRSDKIKGEFVIVINR